MNKTRLEAFSDGVLAIIITIMVLEIKVPHGSDWPSILPLVPVFISYVISFLYVGIYWGNHHHLLHTIKKVSSGILMANLHLLFWLSLIPFATGWMGENHFAPNTIVLYAVVLIACGIAYSILQRIILKNTGDDNELATAIKKQNKKVLISVGCTMAAIPMAYVHPALSGALFLVQSVVWLVPDKNIEEALNNKQNQ